MIVITLEPGQGGSKGDCEELVWTLRDVSGSLYSTFVKLVTHIIDGESVFLLTSACSRGKFGRRIDQPDL